MGGGVRRGLVPAGLGPPRELLRAGPCRVRAGGAPRRRVGGGVVAAAAARPPPASSARPALGVRERRRRHRVLGGAAVAAGHGRRREPHRDRRLLPGPVRGPSVRVDRVRRRGARARVPAGMDGEHRGRRPGVGPAGARVDARRHRRGRRRPLHHQLAPRSPTGRCVPHLCHRPARRLGPGGDPDDGRELPLPLPVDLGRGHARLGGDALVGLGPRSLVARGGCGGARRSSRR